ncbi:TlpA family protein disulfide reductase [Actinomadura sp. 9N215]|uniref:TlpA family protein disulfide reductase n=1 Tax=Actinomadura sp. 9N215 TaxID=3375150 RepID=UPI0037B3BE0A
MPYLTAAVVLVGALCLADLVLSLGIVRRLRVHGALIEHVLTRSTEKTPIKRTGERVDAFSAVTSGGGLVTRESLTESAESVLVGFFSPDCATCRERLPGFVREASRRDETIAVVVGDEPAATELVGSSGLDRAARVVLESPADSPMADAFGVSAFPSACVVDGTGVVLSSDADGHRHESAAASAH